MINIKTFRQHLNFCMPAQVQSAIVKFWGRVISQMQIARQLAPERLRNATEREIKDWFYNHGPNPEDLVAAQKRIHPQLDVAYIFDSSLSRLEDETANGKLCIINYTIMRERLASEGGHRINCPGQLIEDEHYLMFLGINGDYVYFGDSSLKSPKERRVIHLDEVARYWRESNELYRTREEPRYGREPRKREVMILGWGK